MYFFDSKKYKEETGNIVIPEWAREMEGRWVLDFHYMPYFGEVATVDGYTIKKSWCKCI